MTTTYISIGCQCSPRIYITDKLKLTKNKGYRSCPFDLCVTPYQALYDCLKTDFLHFFDDLHLVPGGNAEGDRSECGKGLQNIKNKYGMMFNHESPTHSHLFRDGKNDDDFYIRDDFSEFKKRYKARIDNFYKHIEENDEIILIHRFFKGICEVADLEAICNILREKYPTKRFTYKRIKRA
jgi:hypothetical protein